MSAHTLYSYGELAKISCNNACPCPRGFNLKYATNDQSFCLVWLLFNVPVNNFSVMLGQSHCFLGIYQYFLLLTSSFFYYLSKLTLIQNIFNTLGCKRRPLVNLLFSSSKCSLFCVLLSKTILYTEKLKTILYCAWVSEISDISVLQNKLLTG